MASVNAIAHPVDGNGSLLSHLTLAQKEVLDEYLLLTSALVHMLHCLRLQEEASMVVGCGGFGSSLLCAPSHAQPGHAGDCRNALLKARTSVALY